MAIERCSGLYYNRSRIVVNPFRLNVARSRCSLPKSQKLRKICFLQSKIMAINFLKKSWQILQISHLRGISSIPPDTGTRKFIISHVPLNTFCTFLKRRTHKFKNHCSRQKRLLITFNNTIFN